MNKLLTLLELLLSRTVFYKFHKFLYFLSLKGLGVNNTYKLSSKGDKVVFRNALPQNGTCLIIDIGANVGNYSKDVLTYNSSASVFAFEPHPKTYQKLHKTATEYGFTAINKACGETEGTFNIYDYADNDGSEHATLIKGVFNDIYREDVIATPVEVTTLDSFITSNNIQTVDLLKIDTEGFELSVLKGCEQSLKTNKIKAIHFEFNAMNIISKVFMIDFVKMLPNFTFYRVLQDGFVKIETEQPLLTEIFGFQNIVAIKTID